VQPTILHVEDDVGLATIVQVSFAAFGFRGTVLKAATVHAAQQILDDAATSGDPIDLVISDMSLPDGTGLDLVRIVRHSPRWSDTPILMLSGDTDARSVRLAYALGANSYIAKSPRIREIDKVLRTLYDHWLVDVELPYPASAGRAQRMIARAVSIRSRYAAFYMRVADHLKDNPAEAAFWLTRALREANLSNLFAFIQRHQTPVDKVLNGTLLDEVELMQHEAVDALERAERDMAPLDPREAVRKMLELVEIFAPAPRVQVYTRLVSHLFPIEPVAMAAMCDLVASDLEDLAAWVSLHHGGDPTLDQSARLRGQAAALRALLPEPAASAVTSPTTAPVR
jgi:CheY-like chemotaxis protein